MGAGASGAAAGGRVDDPVAHRLGDRERLAHERVEADQADRVALDAQGVQRRDVDARVVVRRGLGAVAAERRREQDHRPPDRLRGRPRRRRPATASRCSASNIGSTRGHARRHDVRLGDAERLGVDGDVVLRADRRPRVVLVDVLERVRGPGLADPAVADGLERADRVPQLDDRHVRVVDAVDHRLEVVDHDRVHAGDEPRQPQPVRDRSPRGDARAEQRQQLELPVQAPLDHPVVDELLVAAQLGPRVRAEQDPPPVPAGKQPHRPEQQLEQEDPRGRDRAPDPPGLRDGARDRLLVELLDRRIDARRRSRTSRPRRPTPPRRTSRCSATLNEAGRRGPAVQRGSSETQPLRRAVAGGRRDELPAARPQRASPAALHHVEPEDRPRRPRPPSRSPGRWRPTARGGVAVGRRRTPVGRADAEQHLDPAPAEREQLDVRDARAGPAGGRLRGHVGDR